MSLFGGISNALFGDPSKGYNDAQGAYGDWFNKAQGYMKPYVDAGNQALTGYQALLANPNAVMASPGYRFRFDQGQQTLENNALARGGALSGNAARAATEYGQNFATDELNNALARYQPLMQMGYGGASNLGNWALNTSQLMGQAKIGGGNAQFGAGASFLGNLGGGIGSLAKGISSIF